MGVFVFRYRLSLGRVHDLVEIHEGNERLPLRVDADPFEIVAAVKKLEEKIKKLNNGADMEETTKALSYTIFGEKQAEKLYELYNGDFTCVLGICSKYFKLRLYKIILKQQRRAKL